MARFGGIPRELSVTNAQTQLPLEGGRKLRFSNFVAGANRGAVASLRDWLEAADSDLFVIDGPGRSGKTHLLQASIDWWSGSTRPWRLVPLMVGAQLPGPDELPGGLVVVDGLECLQADQALGLTRAIDAAREGRWRVLMATQTPVTELELPFEDLRSRLQWGARMHIKPLDELGLSRVLQQRAEELAIAWPERLTEYLLRRVPRDVGVFLDILAAAYAVAVAEKRPISVPLLTRVLQTAQFATAVEQTAREPQA